MPETLMDDVAPKVATLVRDLIDVSIGQVADFCRDGPDRTTDNRARAAKEYFQAARAGLAQIDTLLKLAKQVAPPAPTDDRPDPADERARILGYIEDAERRVAEHRRTHPDPEGMADPPQPVIPAKAGTHAAAAPQAGLTLSPSKGEADPDPAASLALRQAQGEGCGEAPSSAPPPAQSCTPAPPIGLTLSPSKGEADPPPAQAPPIGLTLSPSKGEAELSQPAVPAPAGLTLSPSKGEADPLPDPSKERPP